MATERNKINERLHLFNDAIRFNNPKRVPTFSNLITWKIHDTDIQPKPTILEATCDWELMEKIVRESIERYNFDAYIDYGTRNNSNYHKVVGMDKMTQVIDDTHGVYAQEPNSMRDSEFWEFGEDQTMYNWTKIMPRRYGKLTYAQIKQIVDYTLEFIDYSQRMDEITVNEYGIPTLMDGNAWLMVAVEWLFGVYRGISKFSLDMRRHAKEIEELSGIQNQQLFAQTDSALSLQTENCIFDIGTSFLAHSVMNIKQFEKLYWPAIKYAIDKAEAADKKMFIFAEADIIRFADFFKDYQKGTLTISVEMENIYDVRKVLPNCCLMGGITVDMLVHNTPAECVAEAKKLCDELGNNGYIMSQNKLLSFKNDAKRDTLKAVQDFVLNYNIN